MGFNLTPTYGAENPCLLIIRSKGYKLGLSPYDGSDNPRAYLATKDDRMFAATNGPELLWLICLWENFGNDWNRQVPDLLGELYLSEEKQGHEGKS